MDEAVASERNRHAIDLFAPLAPTYDRYASLLSFGQDPRWRRFLVSRVAVGADATVVDVATGTGAVAIELARRSGCRVVGFDQSAEMLAIGRERARRAGLADRVELSLARAEDLPLADASADGLTFTYLLRYVDDPLTTLRGLARTLKPGAPAAGLDFGVPRGPARVAWEAYTRAGLPLLGRAISPGWHEVGRFLGPSIREFARAHPLDELLELWRQAGFDELGHRRMSLGGGLVIWGRRAG